MATKVGERLKYEPMKLRFTSTHTANGQANSIIKRGLNQTVAAILPPSYVPSSTTVILYEKLEVSIIDLEAKRGLMVTWIGTHNERGLTYPFLLSKTSTVQDLIEGLSKQVRLTLTGSGKIRVFTFGRDGETRDEVAVAETIGNIPDPVELFAEGIT